MESTIERNDYSPFGSEWTSDVLGTEQKLRFTGHERDLMDPTHTTDDLDWMHARHYNLNLARFLSVDPVGGDPMRPQSWNAYAYVLNNPLRFTDPWGLSEADEMRSDCDDSAAGDSGCGSESDFKKVRAQLWLQAQRFGLTGVDVNAAAHTFFVSFDASLAYYGGAAVEAGVYVNPRNQQGRFDLGLLGDAGVATGWSEGAGLTFGWLFANSSKLDGPFGEVNITAMPLTFTFMFDHNSGNALGITFGPSAGAGAVFTGRQGTHVSFSEGFRAGVVATYRAIMNRYTTPFFPIAH